MIQVKHTVLVFVALSMAACGAPAPSPVDPGEVVTRFMEAVNANNMAGMGETWGTNRGPAANWMNADELRKRLAVMQSFLRHERFEVMSGAPARTEGGRLIVSVQLVTPNRCEATVPFTVVPYRGNWLVEAIDLTAVRPTQVCN